MKINILISFLFAVNLLSCEAQQEPDPQSKAVVPQVKEGFEEATFAGGCFWCVEQSFEIIEGVVHAISGYAGGTKGDPTYQEVAGGKTQYAESVRVIYDPAEISYDQLLEIYFTAHDPTQLNRQGPDIGPQYRSEIFYHTPEQKQKAEMSIEQLKKQGVDVVTKLSPMEKFYPAEEYHQDYYPTHPENPYIQKVSKPKVEKVKKKFQDLLKKV